MRHPIPALAHIAFLCATLWSAPLTADGPSATPEAVKAEFLCRFTAFVRWPPSALAQASFRIGVLGDDPVADNLERIVAARKLLGMDAAIVRLKSTRELPPLHMLYVGSAYTGDLRAVAEAVRDGRVLLVTERDAALDEGAMINFLEIDRRMRFEIAPRSAEASGLKIGSELLGVAVHVREDARP